MCESRGTACKVCRLDYYCGKQHQREDWPRHKKGCGAVELRVDPRLGRHLVAKKDIPKGTVVLRELPLVVVPHHESSMSQLVGSMLFYSALVERGILSAPP